LIYFKGVIILSKQKKAVKRKTQLDKESTKQEKKDLIQNKDYDASFEKLFENQSIDIEKEELKDIVLEGQYKKAYDTILDAISANLYVGLIGPVGTGKTALCRKVASDLMQGFYWVTFSDLIRPSNLIGSFDPTLVFKFGYSPKSFIPGPFLLACLTGAVFLANELNRGDEYVLNSLLDALEERRLYIPQLKRWVKVHEKFFFIAAMNPIEVRGTRKLPQAVKDRIKVWFKLKYPNRQLETKIINSNCPEFNLPQPILNTIIDIINQARKHHDIESPPSIRTSIAIARLLGARISKNKKIKKIPNKLIADCVKVVLPESIETRPGVEVEQFVNKLCIQVLGTG